MYTLHVFPISMAILPLKNHPTFELTILVIFFHMVDFSPEMLPVTNTKKWMLCADNIATIFRVCKVSSEVGYLFSHLRFMTLVWNTNIYDQSLDSLSLVLGFVWNSLSIYAYM